MYVALLSIPFQMYYAKQNSHLLKVKVILQVIYSVDMKTLLPAAVSALAEAAAATLIVRSVSEEPRLVLRGLAPVGAGTGTGDARRTRDSEFCPALFRFGRPGQFVSIIGSEIGIEVPLLETVDEASESEEGKMHSRGICR